MSGAVSALFQHLRKRRDLDLHQEENMLLNSECELHILFGKHDKKGWNLYIFNLQW